MRHKTLFLWTKPKPVYTSHLGFFWQKEDRGIFLNSKSRFFPLWTDKILYKNWKSEWEGFIFATEKKHSLKCEGKKWEESLKKNKTTFSAPEGKE